MHHVDTVKELILRSSKTAGCIHTTLGVLEGSYVQGILTRSLKSGTVPGPPIGNAFREEPGLQDLGYVIVGMHTLFTLIDVTVGFMLLM